MKPEPVDAGLPAAVGELLTRRGETLATAESCTGGLLASRLTDVGGSGEYLLGGVVAYHVGVKRSVLGVSDEAIAHGVVSEAVASELARAARRVLGADWGLGTTGYAGTSPEVPADEHGLVWVAVAGPHGEHAAECVPFGPVPREQAKLGATHAALVLLQRELMR